MSRLATSRPLAASAARAVALSVTPALLVAVAAVGQRDPDAVIERGMVHYRDGELRQARDHFLQAAQVLERIAEAHQRLYRLYSLSWSGLAAQEMGDADPAVGNDKDALRIAEEITHLTASVGTVAFETVRLERAKKVFLRSFDLNRRSRRWEFLLHDLDNLAAVVRRAGTFEGVAGHTQERIDLLRRSDRIEELAVAINDLGAMAVEFSRYADRISLAFFWAPFVYYGA